MKSLFRRIARLRWAVALIGIATASFVSISGCDPRPLIFFLQGEDPSNPAACPTEFKNKKVVILVEVSGSARGASGSLDHDLSRELAKFLKDRVKKIKIVPLDRVWAWSEGNPTATDPGEVGRKFEADVVIMLEVDEFAVTNPADLQMLQGKARVHMKVFEMKYPTNSDNKPMKDQEKIAESVWDGDSEPMFPRNAPIARDSAQSEKAFLRKFIQFTAAEVGWNFANRPIGDEIQPMSF